MKIDWGMTAICVGLLGLAMLFFLVAVRSAAAQDPTPTKTLVQTFNTKDLIDNSNPQIAGSIPKFGLWAIVSLVFLVGMVKVVKVPPWVGILATTIMMLVFGILLDINLIIVGIIVILGGAAAFYARQQQ